VRDLNRHVDNKQDVVSEITTRVASLENERPGDLQSLYEVIDTEALERLFRDTRGTLIFEYLDYEVTVSHDYSVEVTPR
jgi:hypothetical protein